MQNCMHGEKNGTWLQFMVNVLNESFTFLFIH